MGCGRRTIEIKVDATDVFSNREIMIMDYILRRTPEDVRKELSEYYRVTDERIVYMIGKILHKLDCEKPTNESQDLQLL